MIKILKQPFFNQSSPHVAENLLGKFLIYKKGNKKIALQIFETEAYDGPKDKASHASRGCTARNEVMFGPAGYFYVYLCYGMYYMLNVTTDKTEYPSAVLIRGAGEYDGPGKLTKALAIDQTLNALRACPEEGRGALPQSGVWFEDRGIVVKKSDIKKTPRIGVSYAGPVWSEKLFRFVYEL